MERSNHIRYLNRADIEPERWDACIARSGGCLYASSFYLDTMADQWDALVLNDYEAVMPLPWRKKFGISYLYQPFLTAQLGLFGPQLDGRLLQTFLESIPSKFRFWEFPLNHNNLFPAVSFPLYRRINYVLPLTKPYEELSQGYHSNIQRNLKKAAQAGCMLSKNLGLAEIIERSRAQAGGGSEEDYSRLERLYAQLSKKGKAATYGVMGREGRLLASALFAFWEKRAYYLLVGNDPQGRDQGASHALIDGFIREHAGRDLILDFEGSDLPGLARFYSGFGAQEEPYAAIRLNRLPFYLKWLKK